MSKANEISFGDESNAHLEDELLDASGLSCPLPVLKTRKRLKGMEAGKMLHVLATDPASFVDIPHFCNVTGHDLVKWYEDDGTFHYHLRRGEGRV